jgi:hypothetical protein
MSHRILPAALLLCTLAACGQSPTGSDSHAKPAGPAYDGFTMGSGNTASQSGGGFTIGSGNESEETGGYTIGSDGSLEDAGGYGMGSGNVAGTDGFGIGSGGQTTDTDDEPPAEATAERGGYGMGSGN